MPHKHALCAAIFYCDNNDDDDDVVDIFTRTTHLLHIARADIDGTFETDDDRPYDFNEAHYDKQKTTTRKKTTMVLYLDSVTVRGESEN